MLRRMVAGVLLAVAAVAGVHAQSAPEAGRDALLEQARELAREGKDSEAGAVYRQWLGASAPSESYADVLREAVDAQRSARAVLGLLAEFAPRVPEAALREEFQAERVELLRLMGRFDEALGAARQLPDSPRRLALEAMLFYEQGMFVEAAEAARLGLGRAPAPAAAAAARLRHVLGLALMGQGKPVEAEETLRRALSEQPDGPETPALMLAHVEALLACGRAEEAAEAAADLKSRFPASPEAALAAGPAAGGVLPEAGGRIRFAAMPQRLLGGLPPPGPGAPGPAGGPAAAEEAPAPEAPAPQPGPPAARPAPEPEAAAPVGPAVSTPASGQVLLQTGSFRDPENAQYMVRDLEARGFSAEVVTATVGSTMYYRVLVGPPCSVGDAQGLLVRLKEAGFEGMLYFLP